VRTSLGVAGTLLPFAVLFSAFLIFKMDAFRASLSAWIVEFVLVLVFYRMPLVKSLEASVWAIFRCGLVFWCSIRDKFSGRPIAALDCSKSCSNRFGRCCPDRDVEGRSVALVTLVAVSLARSTGLRLIR